jgi:hypothetical protein
MPYLSTFFRVFQTLPGVVTLLRKQMMRMLPGANRSAKPSVARVLASPPGTASEAAPGESSRTAELARVLDFARRERPPIPGYTSLVVPITGIVRVPTQVEGSRNLGTHDGERPSRPVVTRDAGQGQQTIEVLQ